jgi:hypothetical protein
MRFAALRGGGVAGELCESAKPPRYYEGEMRNSGSNNQPRRGSEIHYLPKPSFRAALSLST